MAAAGSSSIRPEVAEGTEHFSVSLTFDDSLFVVELYGELDIAAIPVLEGVLGRAEASPAMTILIDLSGLHFIDSSGIRVLLATTSGPASDRFRFLRAAGQVERILALCEVDHKLPFLD